MDCHATLAMTGGVVIAKPKAEAIDLRHCEERSEANVKAKKRGRSAQAVPARLALLAAIMLPGDVKARPAA
jgi:hypothetical protein